MANHPNRSKRLVAALTALKDALAWNAADIRGFDDIQPDMPMLRARAKLLRDALRSIEGKDQ